MMRQILLPAGAGWAAAKRHTRRREKSWRAVLRRHFLFDAERCRCQRRRSRQLAPLQLLGLCFQNVLAPLLYHLTSPIVHSLQ